MRMRTNAAGLELIKNHEKCVLRAYQDPHGVWTIGWGHTGGVQDGDWISQEEADRLLVEDLIQAERAVSAYVHVPINENQFSALVSFVFNEGAGRFYSSSILERLNQKDFEGACKALGAYTKMRIKGGGFVDSRELEGRRAQEQALFLAPVTQLAGDPSARPGSGPAVA